MAAVNLGKATAIIPQLKELVTLIQVKRPLYEFHATSYRERRDADTGAVTVWVSEFEVVQDADRVGEIAYEHAVGRRLPDGSQPDAFVIRSENISKQRGMDRTSKITTNMNVALKEVIKVFSAPTEASLCTALVRKVRDAMDNREYGWRRVLQDIVSYSGAEVYQWIIESHLKGEVQPMPPSFKVDATKIHLYDRFLAGKEIVTASQYNKINGVDRKGIIVQILSDNTIRTVPFSYDPRLPHEENNGKLMRYRNFDEMPLTLQERIAVLKIAEEDDPISNVGVKFDEDLMYILE
jgi:hypothetical protein